MTATVKEFCRVYGIDEKSEKLVDKIYEAIIGGDNNREPIRYSSEREEKQTTVSDSD